jgi:hypothetical protein
MQIVEAVARHEWWPYRTMEMDGGSPDTLWLAVPPDRERELLNELTVAWSDLEWLVMGTWHRKQAALSAQGFAERYPGLARELVGRGESESPRGLVSSSEWCIADPACSLLYDFLSIVRRARGKGGCLVLAPPGFSRRTWYALSAGMQWRSVLAAEFDGPGGIEELDREIIAQYLSQLAKNGFAAMIPLDFHPCGGYVVVGNRERLASMANRLPKTIASYSAIEVANLVAGGGGLAL